MVYEPRVDVGVWLRALAFFFEALGVLVIATQSVLILYSLAQRWKMWRRRLATERAHDGV